MRHEPVVAVLERAQWDFSSIPQEHLWRAWSYEFGRHCPWVLERFQPAGCLDECGNWLYQYDRDGDGEHVIQFCFPKGFPDEAFSEALKKANFPNYPHIRVPSVRQMHGGGKADGHERKLTLAIKLWRPKKTIKADFAELLEDICSVDTIERRGHSEDKRFGADLKALGAFRLLRAGLTRGQAIDLTRGKGNRDGLFRDKAEWSVAKRRALAVFKNDFGIPAEAIII